MGILSCVVFLSGLREVVVERVRVMYLLIYKFILCSYFMVEMIFGLVDFFSIRILNVWEGTFFFMI